MIVIWERASTSDDHQYRLGYPVGGSYQYITLYNRYKIVTDFDTSIGYDSTAGTVQTVMFNTYSHRVNCTSITQSPTVDPTLAPSAEPTVSPSYEPTAAPTFSNHYSFFYPDSCSQDRCDCSGMELSCIGDAVFVKWEEGATRIVQIEQRPINFDQSTLVKYYIEYVGAANSNDTDDDDEYDYNITGSLTTVRRRRMMIDYILSKRYGKDNSDFDVDTGKIIRDNINNNDNNNNFNNHDRSLLDTSKMNCSEDYIKPMSGAVNVIVRYSDSAQTDVSGNYASVSFTVDDNSVNTSAGEFALYRLVLERCDINDDSSSSHVYSCR